MNKGLEALDDFKFLYEGGYIKYNSSWQEAPIILEALNHIETALKVLEIIKNKCEISKPVGIDIENNRVSFGCLVQKKDLTKKEYDLLKEVLL